VASALPQRVPVWFTTCLIVNTVLSVNCLPPCNLAYSATASCQPADDPSHWSCNRFSLVMSPVQQFCGVSDFRASRVTFDMPFATRITRLCGSVSCTICDWKYPPMTSKEFGGHTIASHKLAARICSSKLFLFLI
jgi:hypothetical protein